MSCQAMKNMNMVGIRARLTKVRTRRVRRREPKTRARRSTNSLVRWRKIRKVNRRNRMALTLTRPKTRRLPVKGWPPWRTR